MVRRTLPAVFALLFSSSVWAGQQTLFSFVRPASVVNVATEDAGMPQYNAEQTAEGEVLRRVVFNPAQRPTLRLSPQSGVWDWSSGKFLTLRLQSAMDWALTVDVTVQGSDGRTLTSRIDLPAGPAQTVMVPLTASSPLSQGMRAGPPMPWLHGGQRLLLTSSAGAVDLKQVASVSLSIPGPKVAQNLLIERVGIQDDDQAHQAAYRELIDAYGQSTRGSWPEKVANDEQLKAAATREQQQLKAWLAERGKQQLDAYGGLLAGPAFAAEGFFRTEKRDGRWYLITPDGHPFYSLGVNAVAADGGRTYTAGREAMFKALPGEGDALGAFYGEGNNDDGNASSQGRNFKKGRWFDFYAANLQRAYGKPCPPAATAQPAACPPLVVDTGRWQAHALDRLQAWGFNTLGNWSEPALGQARRMPYTLPLSIVGDYASISTGMDWWGRMPDPFDPRFAMATERAVAIAARDHRDDPWLIGYFADNELAWAAPGSEPKARYGLAYGTLRLTTDVPAKRAFLKQLRDKYRNQEGLSKAWGIELNAWELMEDPGFEAPLPSPEHPEIERDYQHFQQVFAETYFKTISDALKWHAPNHLLLGGRYAVSTPEAVNACAEFCDVLSFNFYTLKPQDGYDFARLAELDKPVLVSEFQFGSRDRGPFWPGPLELAREEDRGPAYANFLTAALQQPMIVGAHWFQYLDQPASGRLLDGENGHLGLVAITDVPYPGFIDAVRKANAQAMAQLRTGLEKKPAP
ncbi:MULTISPECIES: beta-galactosidase [Pseudomonas]|uniref:Beta-galactosidase n=1 Tax=Pseudomonas juntendi TaxID=2666183 RepID=A0A7W2LX79_9PSED|nr:MULTISPECIES: beta-galactosidase [Pseudomonas]MBA6133462.1 beta-galactosidase [Pseudomonas juntendi]MBA6148740.1 beta-galactosidase [Pseudomonas juntendi]MCK2108956.1 beta-galactosidase [Pseudomonas juntendi]MCK2115765.1 beta-galactosidase [Pseudomonas juntendi]MCO7057032.1 beta-galactosidase [Pseudomonas juntendi]